MKALFLENGRQLGKPVNWDDSMECDTLSVEDYTLEDGTNVMRSQWLPTGSELDAILAGEPITLWVCGSVHPPVAVGVNAYDKYEEVAEKRLTDLSNNVLQNNIRNLFPPEKEEKAWLFTEHMTRRGFVELGIGNSVLTEVYGATPAIVYEFHRFAQTHAKKLILEKLSKILDDMSCEEINGINIDKILKEVESIELP